MKRLLFLTLISAFALVACSPVVITNSSGQQPGPIVDADPIDEPASVSPDILATTGYQSVEVVDVTVEVVVGSPIPVFVNIGADLPDRCAQVEFVEVIQDGALFKIHVGTLPSKDAACAADTVPFRMKIPLNVVGLPAGSYAVEVNGVHAGFKLDLESAATELHTQEMPITNDEIVVDEVSVEVGLGSPRPVSAVMSANLPSACAQLGQVQMHREGNQYFVRLIAYVPAEMDCNPDTLPMRIELPLNTINLPDGTYEVLVNGASSTFEMPLK